MNTHRQLGQCPSRTPAAGPPFPASSSPCLPPPLPPCVRASVPTQPRTQLHAPRITSHKPACRTGRSRVPPFKSSRITQFLIDIWRLEIDVTTCRYNKTHYSNRHGRGTFPFCTIATKLAKVFYSLPNLVCYSRRRTRVPPLGLRALAPARPTWCESLPLPGHRELSVSSASQFGLEASKLNGDFRARSYAN